MSLQLKFLLQSEQKRLGKISLRRDDCSLIVSSPVDLQHHLFLLTFSGELHMAPIHEIPGRIQNVLDFATGTGIWAVDFGMSPSPSQSKILQILILTFS